MIRFFSVISVVFLLSIACSAQPETAAAKKAAAEAQQAASALKSSPAYAEVILRKTELEADLESMMVEFTDEYPKVKEARVELDLLQKELDRLVAVKPAESGKLSLALGKLMVRKVALGTDLATLRGQYDDKHPDVISARKKVQVFEKAIKDILSN